MIWLLAFVASIVLTPMLIPLLRRVAVDNPNHRSSHAVPTPRGGGLAVLAVFSGGLWVGASSSLNGFVAVLLCALAVGILGLVDDVRGVPAPVRLVLVLVAGGVAAHSAVAGFETGRALWMGTIAGSVLLAGYTNAFNFMDGINGISALVAAVTSGWLAVLGATYGADDLRSAAALLCGAVLGFLPWNAPRARVFLGDVGSYGIGFSLAALGILIWASGAPFTQVAAPFVLYVADTGVTVLKRAARRESLFAAHREHAYQELVAYGWSHLGTAAFVAALSATCCVAAWILGDAPWPATWLVFAAVATAYVLMPRLMLATRKASHV